MVKERTDDQNREQMDDVLFLELGGIVLVGKENRPKLKRHLLLSDRLREGRTVHWLFV